MVDAPISAMSHAVLPNTSRKHTERDNASINSNRRRSLGESDAPAIPVGLPVKKEEKEKEKPKEVGRDRKGAHHHREKSEGHLLREENAMLKLKIDEMTKKLEETVSFMEQVSLSL